MADRACNCCMAEMSVCMGGASMKSKEIKSFMPNACGGLGWGFVVASGVRMRYGFSLSGVAV